MSILDGALQRAPFGAEGGRTGAAFERAVLRDGTPVIVKHVSPDDLFPTMVGEADRTYRLWRSGVFDRLPPAMDHATIAVEREGNGAVIVMRDVSDVFLSDDRVLSRDESAFVMRTLHAMHDRCWDETFDGATTIDERLNVFANLGAGDWYLADLWKRGWELFPDLVPRDVADVVVRLRDDPSLLSKELGRSRQTFVHGDLRLHNMGLAPSRLVLVDWEVAGIGSPAMEFAWYLIISATRIEATREQVVDDYRSIAGEHFDARAWDVACLFALLALGWNKAIDIVDSPDDAHVARERADLDWWTGRVRDALDTWSPL